MSVLIHYGIFGRTSFLKGGFKMKSPDLFDIKVPVLLKEPLQICLKDIDCVAAIVVPMGADDLLIYMTYEISSEPQRINKVDKVVCLTGDGLGNKFLRHGEMQDFVYPRALISFRYNGEDSDNLILVLSYFKFVAEFVGKENQKVPPPLFAQWKKEYVDHRVAFL